VPMADFLLHEEWARATSRRCAALDVEDARLELVVRPAHRGEQWGYGLTVYCYAGGADEAHAGAAWARAVEQVTPVLIGTAESLFASPEELRGRG
jgi:hypothetical protein